MDKNVGSLFLKHGSDKYSHGYADFYEQHLPNNPKSILEIGVKNGASILAWKELFPEASIHGVDLFQEFPVPDIPGVKWWQGNQTDQYLLEQLRNEHFDVIVEDASHDCRKHWITLWSLIDSCKQYYIEDLHTCKDEYFREGLSYKHTVLSCAKASLLPFDFVLSENENIVLICQK